MRFEIDGLTEFIDVLNQAINGGFKDRLGLWLEAMGMEFLDIVQDEIIKAQSVDTRWLLNSFGRGDSENVFILSQGGLTLEVGTKVKYAQWVNSGHRQKRRWVPGHWSGERFVYVPNAKTGMMLTERWVPGSHYWDIAFMIFEKMFGKGLDKKLQEWLDEAF